MDRLPAEIKHKINSFNQENPWKNKFDDVITQLTTDSEFQCQICWNSSACSNAVCYDRIRYTNQSCYQDSYNEYHNYLVSYENIGLSCYCVISLKIISCFLDC